MNKKSNNAWILCTSKRFPGKHYYFNVITGEAAWCLADEEIKDIAKDVAIKKMADKGHPYPEPNTPPTDDRPETAKVCYNFTTSPNIPTSYQMGPPPIVSQPVFSRYIPNQYMPGYVIPMPPMFVASKPEPMKRSIDQITQTSDIQVTCLKGYTIPLSKRFGIYRQMNNGTKTFEKKDNCVPTQNKVNTLASNMSHWCNIDCSKVNFSTMLNNCNKIKVSNSTHTFFNSNVNNVNQSNQTFKRKIMKDPVLKLVNRKANDVHNFDVSTSNKNTVAFTKSVFNQETHREIRNSHMIASSAMNTEIEHCLRKLAFDTENIPITKENLVHNTDYENIPKQPDHKFYSNGKVVLFQNEINDAADDIDNTEIHLSSSDLRLVLQAKRKKQKLDWDTQTKDNFSSMSQHFNNDLNKLKEKAKQVALDLGSMREIEKEIETPTPEESEVQTMDSENIIETNSPTPQMLNISYLKSLVKTFLKSDPWYVVVDIGVLLNNFEFIEDFVKRDTTCRLLVPNSVRSDIETMSVEEYGGRSWVMLARKVMRRLRTMEKFIILQPPIVETASTSAIDRIIECCLQVLKSNHAVLITTDAELYSKGISSGIYTFKLEDIKKSGDNESKVLFSVVQKTGSQNSNIFMQNIDNFEVFPLSKNNCVPVNARDITKIPTTVKKNPRKSLEGYNMAVSNPVTFDNSDIITGTTSSKKIKLIRKKVNVNKQDNIEDDIKLLSLQEITQQNSKLCDNLKVTSQKYLDLNIRKVIVDTKVKNDNKEEKYIQNFRPDQQRRIFRKPVVNPPNNLGNGLAEVSSTSEFGLKIKPLTITVPGKLQNLNTAVKDIHSLRINAYTVEDLLKRFYVKDAKISHRIESRLDEWVCCYYQIMEECLIDVLMTNTQGKQNKLSAPWTLLDAVLCLRGMYSSNTAVKTIADKLSVMLSDLSDNKDNLKSKMKSADFIKLFGCGALLVESLKSILPQSPQILESEQLLQTLLHHIQNPSTDIDLPYTPMRVVRSEIDNTETKRNIVSKKPSEIIEYLKVNFPAWKDFDERHLITEQTKIQENDLRNERNVVRTFGKSLNTVKITNAKEIIFDNTPVRNPPEFKENIEMNMQKDVPRITRTINNIQTDTENDNKKYKSNNDLNKRTSNVRNTSEFKENTEINIQKYVPRITRTVNNIQRDTEKDNKKLKCNNNLNKHTNNVRNTPELKESTEINFEKGLSRITSTVNNIQRDTEKVNSKNKHISKVTPTDKANNIEVTMSYKYLKNFMVDDESLDYEELPMNNDNEMEAQNYEISLMNTKDNDQRIQDDKENCKDSTNDSGFVNQSLDTCLFIRLFLKELSASFKLIYTFIDDSIQEFRCDVLKLNDRKVLYDKANETHLYVADIIGKLKRIIDREADESTQLKSLIINAGVEALTDKRLTRYRQVIMKCLEQAQLLEGALKTVLALTNEHCDITAVDIDDVNYPVPCFNIFE